MFHPQYFYTSIGFLFQSLTATSPCLTVLVTGMQSPGPPAGRARSLWNLAKYASLTIGPYKCPMSTQLFIFVCVGLTGAVWMWPVFQFYAPSHLYRSLSLVAWRNISATRVPCQSITLPRAGRQKFSVARPATNCHKWLGGKNEKLGIWARDWTRA